ncbi:membrane protein [Salmonella enterica subsp. enterica]|nr:membrane protein [Salmonella enterica subsp. enterica] [Salmonella enterica subsp. enterica serovar Singapore]VEA27011.1 membrane protein [Salmonella enterica subsp. enterica]
MKSENKKTSRKITDFLIYGLISVISGWTFILCLYWLLYLNTWTLRIVYIIISILISGFIIWLLFIFLGNDS